MLDQLIFARKTVAALDGKPYDPASDPDLPRAEPQVRIPALTLANVPKYIRAVARALERGQIDVRESNGMLYAAQMLVAAYRVLGDADEDGADAAAPAKRIGFIRAAAEAFVTQSNDPEVDREVYLHGR